jgi:hypothetical protein
VGLVEGSIRASARASWPGIAGVEDQGMLPKGSPVNPGDLAICSEHLGVRFHPTVNEPGLWDGGVVPTGANKSPTEHNRHQAQAEVVVMDSPEVLRPHGTEEGGEPQGFQRWKRPRYPLEGRGKQMGGTAQ